MAMAGPRVQFAAVLGWIQSWIIAKDKEGCFPKVCFRKGGWEGWAQSEVEMWLERHPLPGTPAPSILCEQNIFTSANKEVDFLIVQGNKKMSFELKCESLFHSADQGRVHGDHTFYKGVEKDYAKLETERHIDHSSQPALVIALCFSDEASKPLADRGYSHETFTVGDGTWKMHMFVKVVSSDW